jgi:hypothetical protein
MRDTILVLGVGLLAASLSTGARAQQPMQPGGVLVPVTNVLQTALTADGDTVNPTTDARTVPETFRPDCSLTFTVLARGAGFDNSFGWYNVTGTKPLPGELYEFVGCNDDVGAVKVLDLTGDTRYLGGEIAFFEATPEGRAGNCANVVDYANSVGHVYYSEARFNEDNVPGAASFIHLLIMDSKVRTSSFFFGWEDRFSGGDNDFDDLLMRVDGIQCAGGGADCDTGMPSHCGKGVMRCVNGELVCGPRTTPRDEKCNAIDDDCNGTTDEGELCDKGYLCDHGSCIKRCSDNEFPCPAGFVCRDDGFCLDKDCVDVTCAEGKVCVKGACLGACDGVKCPFGSECVGGACVDLCDGVTCPAGQVCDGGACVSCCNGCPKGTTCDDKQTACLTPDCVDMSCGPGTHCGVPAPVAGEFMAKMSTASQCVDDCDGVVCPRAQACLNGLCIVDENADSASSNNRGTGGMGGRRGATLGDAPAATSTGGVGDSAGTGGAGSSPRSRRSAEPPTPGCAVSVPAERAGGSQFVWFTLCALGLCALRRRASCHPRSPA